MICAFVCTCFGSRSWVQVLLGWGDVDIVGAAGEVDACFGAEFQGLRFRGFGSEVRCFGFADTQAQARIGTGIAVLRRQTKQPATKALATPVDTDPEARQGSMVRNRKSIKQIKRQPQD